jgi:hypothetical protein
MRTISREVQLAGQAQSEIRAVVAVGFVISRANHVGNISGDWFYLVIELVQDLVILCSLVVEVEGCDISPSFLLDPGISVRNVTNYELSADSKPYQTMLTDRATRSQNLFSDREGSQSNSSRHASGG